MSEEQEGAKQQDKREHLSFYKAAKSYDEKGNKMTPHEKIHAALEGMCDNNFADLPRDEKIKRIYRGKKALAELETHTVISKQEYQQLKNMQSRVKVTMITAGESDE